MELQIYLMNFVRNQWNFLANFVPYFFIFEERDAWNNYEQINVINLSGCLPGMYKEAVRFWILQKTGQLLYPSDIYVHHDQYGARTLTIMVQHTYTTPEVSLSHNNCASLVAVSESQCP